MVASLPSRWVFKYSSSMSVNLLIILPPVVSIYMDCCDDRSASRRSTASLPLCVLISRCASSPLVRSRQTMTTVAPIRANPSAVALPMPELAPVIRHTFPCILVFNDAMMTLLKRKPGTREECHSISFSQNRALEALNHDGPVLCHVIVSSPHAPQSSPGTAARSP